MEERIECALEPEVMMGWLCNYYSKMIGAFVAEHEGKL